METASKNFYYRLKIILSQNKPFIIFAKISLKIT